MASALKTCEGQNYIPAMPAEGLQTSRSSALQPQKHAGCFGFCLKKTSLLQSMTVCTEPSLRYTSCMLLHHSEALQGQNL